MANVTILSSVVQGLPEVIVLTGSTVVPLASNITESQAGTGYFYQGQVVDSTLIGDSTVISTLTALGAIA